jgi:hypothetical protein
MAMGNRSPGTRRNADTRGRDDTAVDVNYRERNVTTVNNTNENGDVKDEQIGSYQPAAQDDHEKVSVDASRNGDGTDIDLEVTSGLKDETGDTRKPETPMEFTVVLDCVPKNSHKVASLSFTRNYPKTIPDLKQGIEDNFGIPTCCQDVFLENIQLDNHCSLKFYRVRDGDTFHVRYTSEADVEDILNIVGSLCSMITYIERIQPILSKGKPTEFLTSSIPENIFADKVESLAVRYFFPCSSERANANRLLFVQRGGLDLMHKVHELLLLQPWKNVPIEMQYLEHAILRVLWNVTASFTIRHLVLQRPTLKAITKSFLRVEVPKQGIITAPVNNFSFRSTLEQNRITSEVVYKAAGSLCK